MRTELPCRSGRVAAWRIAECEALVGDFWVVGVWFKVKDHVVTLTAVRGVSA